MAKRIVLVLFLILINLGFVFAQVDGVIDTAEGINEKVENTRDIVDGERYGFLADSWKEFFLRNALVARVDAGLTKISPVFTVLFSRSYSFSLEIFFILFMWIFTLISIVKYIPLKKEWQRWLVALAGTIVISHLQIFNILSEAFVKFMFFRSSPLWSFLTFIFLMVALVIYVYINKYCAGLWKKYREQAEKTNMEKRVKRQEEFYDMITKGAAAP